MSRKDLVVTPNQIEREKKGQLLRSKSMKITDDDDPESPM